jgi:hypothetical protein
MVGPMKSRVTEVTPERIIGITRAHARDTYKLDSPSLPSPAGTEAGGIPQSSSSCNRHLRTLENGRRAR